jgi:hypothetical protein
VPVARRLGMNFLFYALGFVGLCLALKELFRDDLP